MKETLKIWKELQNKNYFEHHPCYTEGLTRENPDVPKEFFEGKTILDFGCGFGRHFPYFFENGVDYIFGVDVSENILQKAQNWLSPQIDMKRIKLITEDKMDYIPDNSIDFIYSHTVFQHMYPDAATNYFKQFTRIMRLGAKTKIQFLVANNWQSFLDSYEPNFYYTKNMVENLFHDMKINKITGFDLPKNTISGASWLIVWAEKEQK